MVDTESSGTGAEYVSGACNIGRAERRRRYAVGVAGFLLAAAVVVAVVSLSLPSAALLSAVLPLFLGFLGVLQARRGFCVAFARAGVYDLSDGGGQRRTVSSGDDRERDVAYGRLLYRDAALAAAGVAIALFVVGDLVGY